MQKKVTIIFLAIYVLLAFFLHFYKFNQVPACLNADEAAFGYNAYSLLKTGRDEYGTILPSRLKSFGDFKLPFYSYLDIPFVATIGLNQLSTRLPAGIIAILFPIVMFLLVKQLFKNEKTALIAAFLISVSPWFQIMSRQAHEAIPATFFLVLALIFLLRFREKQTTLNAIFFSVFIFLGLFSYHISRVIALFFIGYWAFFIYKKFKNGRSSLKLAHIIIIIIPLLIFGLTELAFNPTRVENLLFYKNPGFSLRIDELRGEHDSRSLHNKVTQALIELPKEYLRYLSPEFLTIHGDENPRFGFIGISLITPVEYLLVIVGLYYLFAKKYRHRFLVIGLLLISPLSASLAWQSYSLNRSFFLIIPLMVLAAVGVIELTGDRKTLYKKILIAGLIIGYLFPLFYSWDFYFNHYPKRATVVRAWQCGYRELTDYIRDNYHRFDHFYITRRNGQPYIYLLYYLKYSPQKYQKAASLSGPDQYGFGQVDRFDKFVFDFKFDKKEKRAAFIGFPDEFNGTGVDTNKVKKIKIGTEEIFWIYEN